MTAWQQGLSGSHVVKHGRESLEENTQLKETIQALEVKVEGLQKSILELKQQQEEPRQSVLLGQLVSGLDDIVRIQVMGPNFPPSSLADIQRYVNEDYVSAEGQRKWDKFVNLLQEQGLSVQKVVTACKPLRRQRFAVAHGTTEEQASVSTAQIREWTAARNLQPMVETILKVLSPLTRDDRPLLPRNNIDDLFA